MADGQFLLATRTTCPYCGVGCGIKASPTGDNSALIDGDDEHPANFGRLCSKGSALGETLGKKGRLLTPFVDGKRVNWDSAMTRVADGFKSALENYGPDSVAFYLSGQLLTEDYYVANKLMKGFIGSANVDTNSRLCMASAVVGYKRAFGSDTVPCDYEDLECCDLLILTGSNLAWCHPVLFQRIAAEKQRRPELQVIVIDPRRTASCDIATHHLALKPGSDIPLWQGLFAYLNENNAIDTHFIREHTSGFDDVVDAAAPFDLETVSAATGVSTKTLLTFFEAFARTDRVVTVFSMGVNQATDGSDRANAIINAHLVTGRIGKPGMGPFSMTGQPNAMGGREVGGLANQLACHMDFDPVSRDRVGRFWQTEAIAPKPGLKAVDLFEAVGDGQIKAIWIMGTNPVVSMPDADRVKAALKKCPLVVVSDIVPDTDTARCATVLLPATGWGEKSGTVTNSERRISRQRGFLPAPGLARHDWQAVCDLAVRLGFRDGFEYDGPASIFREFAAMTAFENDGTRDLDLGGLATLSDEAFDVLTPVQWPVPAQVPAQVPVPGPEGTPVRPAKPRRLFSDGRFYTPDGRARFVAPVAAAINTSPGEFVLNTGRIRDHWHTMTRTGRAPRLNAHISEPFIEIHPDDAKTIGLTEDGLAIVHNDRGKIYVRTIITDRQHRGTVFIPMHWTGIAAKAARVDTVIAPQPDPVSGQPALKSSSVKIAPFEAAWYGFATGLTLEAPHTAYWARAKCERGYRMELADSSVPGDWSALRKSLWKDADTAEVIDIQGDVPGSYRCVQIKNGRITGVLIIDSEPVPAARDWLCDQLGCIISGTDRSMILTGFPPQGVIDPGPTVCSCLGVGKNIIKNAIHEGCHSVTAIGECTGAGTNCGSCRPEIQKILEVIHVPA